MTTKADARSDHPSVSSDGDQRGEDRAVPTLAEMEANYGKFCDAVDSSAITLASIFAAVCADQIEKIIKAIKSGDYALVSKADREMALRKQGNAVAAMMCLSRDHEQLSKDAQVLLQLIPAEAKKPASLRVGKKPRRVGQRC